jgi:gliding motility-associatede transport system auxiliary component
MAANWMKARQTKYSAYMAVYIIVILAVLAGINFLGNRYSKAYDATKNKRFTLSDQTIKIVQGLKTPVKLVYFGETNSFPEGRNLLDRYSALSSRISVQYVDPVKKPQIAKAEGFRSDSPVVVENGPKREGAKSLTEEEVTGALIRVMKTGERNVCFVTGFGEHSIDDTEANGYSVLKALLERDNYKSRAVTLKPAAAATDAGKKLEVGQAPPAAANVNVEVPSDCTVTIAGGPQSDYPQPVVDALKKYVENGGRAMFMLDQSLRIGRSEPAGEQAALRKVLADWGATVNKDLVLDLSGLGQIFGFGPEVPVVLQYESHAITQPLTRIPTAYPLTQSIEIKSGSKATVEKLVSTTDDSLATSEIGPGGQVDPKKGKKGPLTLVAAATYPGTRQGRFVVAGTSLWAVNSFAGSRQLGNRDLFVNSVNWLSSDEDLISILPKTPEDQALNVTGYRLRLMFWLSIVIFPLAVVGFGLATWWKRR